MSTATQTAIEADPKLPIIRITREFAATPGQLFRAHTDPALFARWVGPDAADTRIEHWDARTGGSWRSLVDSFEGRDAWLASGMATGVNDGYAALQKMVDDGAV